MDDEDVVWQGTFDQGAWRVSVTVIPDGKARAMLRIRDRDGVLLHQHEVVLMFGAIFGPDVADVEAWTGYVLQWLEDRDEQSGLSDG